MQTITIHIIFVLFLKRPYIFKENNILKLNRQNILLLSNTHGMHQLLDFPRGSLSSSIAAMSAMQVICSSYRISLCGMRGFPYHTRYLSMVVMISPFELEPQRSKNLYPKESTGKTILPLGSTASRLWVSVIFLFFIRWNPTCRLISWYHTIRHRVFWTMAMVTRRSVSLFWNDPLATMFSVITIQTMVR